MRHGWSVNSRLRKRSAHVTHGWIRSQLLIIRNMVNHWLLPFALSIFVAR